MGQPLLTIIGCPQIYALRDIHISVCLYIYVDYHKKMSMYKVHICILSNKCRGSADDKKYTRNTLSIIYHNPKKVFFLLTYRSTVLSALGTKNILKSICSQVDWLNTPMFNHVWTLTSHILAASLFSHALFLLSSATSSKANIYIYIYIGLGFRELPIKSTTTKSRLPIFS